MNHTTNILLTLYTHVPHHSSSRVTSSHSAWFTHVGWHHYQMLHARHTGSPQHPPPLPGQSLHTHHPPLRSSSVSHRPFSECMCLHHSLPALLCVIHDVKWHLSLLLKNNHHAYHVLTWCKCTMRNSSWQTSHRESEEFHPRRYSEDTPLGSRWWQVSCGMNIYFGK